MPTFVTPLLLAGGLLIAVPIVLHLVMRQKPRHLVFPALRFIKQRREANRRRLRLRHLLLLILRCAAILFLALALARPIFHSAGLLSGSRAPEAAALIIDTRPRMEYRHRNQTWLESAQKLSQELLRQLPSDSDFVVLDAGSARTRFDVDRGAAAQRLNQLAITYTPRDLIDIFDNALRVVSESDKERKEVFLYTDLARADWATDEMADAWRQRLADNPDIAVYVIDVGLEQPRNFGLGEIALSAEVISETQLLRVSTDVYQLGGDGERTVQLFMTGPDGQTEKRGEQTIEVSSDAASLVEFTTAVEGLGTHQGRIRFARSDNLKSDNERFFTVHVKTPWQVLIVAAEPAEQNAGLLPTVLAPSLLRRRGEAQYESKTVSFSALQGESLETYDAIWLLDPPPLKTALWNRLSSYVAGGGGLAMALGGRAGLSGERFSESASLEVLPAPLKRQWKTAGDRDLYLAPDRLEHPVLQSFKSREGQIPWDLNPIFKLWEIGPAAESVEVLLKYSDGRPALLSRHVGQGRVLTMTTPFSSSGRKPWNLLLLRREESWPAFWLVHGMTEYMVGSVGQRRNFETGEIATIVLQRDKAYDAYLMSTPQGTRRVQDGSQSGSLVVTATDAPGQYILQAGGRQGVRYGFSVNLGSDVTQLDRADPEQLQEKLGELSLPIVRSTAELDRSRKVAAARARWEAFPWLMLVVAMVVAGESLVSSLFYRRSGEKAK